MSHARNSGLVVMRYQFQGVDANGSVVDVRGCDCSGLIEARAKARHAYAPGKLPGIDREVSLVLIFDDAGNLIERVDRI